MSGRRPGIFAEAILDDWQTECRKAGWIAIGADDQVRDLGPQALDNSEDRWPRAAADICRRRRCGPTGRLPIARRRYLQALPF